MEDSMTNREPAHRLDRNTIVHGGNILFDAEVCRRLDEKIPRYLRVLQRCRNFYIVTWHSPTSTRHSFPPHYERNSLNCTVERLIKISEKSTYKLESRSQTWFFKVRDQIYLVTVLPHFLAPPPFQIGNKSVRSLGRKHCGCIVDVRILALDHGMRQRRHLVAARCCTLAAP